MPLDVSVICRITDPDERWREALERLEGRVAEIWLLDASGVLADGDPLAARRVPLDPAHVEAPELAALRACGGAWILWLEPDELPHTALLDRLDRLAAEGALGRMGAYRVTVRTVVAGRGLGAGDCEPRSSLRLFRREGSRFAPRPGAQFIAPPAGQPLGRLREAIECRPFRGFDDYLRRVDRAVEREFAGGWPQPRSVRLLTVWPARFLELWILKGGWRDGRAGALWAGARASASFLREMRIWVQAHAPRPRQVESDPTVPRP